MKVSVSTVSKKYDALFILIPEKKWDSKTFGKILSKEIESKISKKMNKKYFEGKLGECMEVCSSDGRVFLFGMGKGKEKLDIRKSASLAIRKAKKIKAKKIEIMVPKTIDFHRIISGALLGSYEFKIGDTSKQFTPTEVSIITDQKVSQSEIENEVVLGESTNTLRDLVNLPPNIMTPSLLAQKAEALGKKYSNITVKVLGEKEIQKLKMGALYEVGRGSDEESKVIIFEYHGGKKSEKPLAFVGKGVTFDSGGYNLKPTGHMEDMKSDMTGAATVFGLFEWIARTKPNKNIVGIMGAVENMVSGNAYRPGDIITAMNGQTIEITNTDAEGRLVLADCLYYTATKYKPAMMFNFATLTGAVIAALGSEITGVMGNNSKTMDLVKKSALATDEVIWQLPITDLFRKKIKGHISDLLNWTAGVSAGSSMAGAFLENFVEKTPWVHFDIAGTGFHDKSGDDLSPRGATGVMLRTLTEIVK